MNGVFGFSARLDRALRIVRKGALLKFPLGVLLLPVCATGFAGGPIRHPSGPSNFDIRYQESKAPAQYQARVGLKSPTAAASVMEMQNGKAELKANVPGIKLSEDEIFASPKSITSSKGVISKANGSPEDTVRDFVSKNRKAFGLGNARYDEQIKTHAAYKNPGNGVNWVHLEQSISGIPVFQGELKAAVNANGELVSIVNQIAPGIDENVGQTAPLLSAEDALGAAGKALGWNVPQSSELVRKTQDANGNDVEFGSMPNYKILHVTKVIFPLSPGDAVQAWLVTIHSGAGLYMQVVDGASGRILFRKNGLNDQTKTATYEVYDGDSPAPGTPWPYPPDNGVFASTTQADYTSRTKFTLISENPAFDNLGWINDINNFTRGNNVWAGRDQLINDGIDQDLYNIGFFSMPYGVLANTIAGAISPNSRNFIFTYLTGELAGNTWDAPPGGIDGPIYDPAAGTPPPFQNEPYDSGSVTNMFFWVNRYHDILYNLGFTEASRNFQDKNFSRGGQEGDAVDAQAQDFSGTDNANFATPPDGMPGTMQMYVFPDMVDTSGAVYQTRRDGALDQQVMVHELTHGLSNRLIGNGTGLLFQQGGGMGEGWSDFYAMSIMNLFPNSGPNARTEAKKDPDLVYPNGGWITYYLGGNIIHNFRYPASFDNYFYGIRRFPYCTQTDINPLQWADADPQQYNVTNGIYPESPWCWSLGGPQSPGGGAEVHNLGEIWCAMLWQARGNIMTRFKQSGFDFSTGNLHSLQLVTDALKLTDINPTFISARDAVLQAALLQTSGTLSPAFPGDPNTDFAAADELAVWKGFVDRGLGVSAVAPPPQDASLVEEQPDNYYTIQRSGYNFNERPTSHPLASRFSSGAIKLNLDHNGTIQVFLGKPLSFYQKQYTSLYVNSNGSITFKNNGDRSSVVSTDHHFNQARISGLLADYDPSTSGVITYEISKVANPLAPNDQTQDLNDWFYLTFENVPLSGSLSEVGATFQVQVGFDEGPHPNEILFKYAVAQPSSAIVGLSRGTTGSTPADFTPDDFTVFGPCNTDYLHPDYFTELFTDPTNKFDLQFNQLAFYNGMSAGWTVPPVEAFDFPVTMTQPLVDDSAGNNDGALNPGETVNLKVPFGNEFVKAKLSTVVGVMTTSATGITIINPVSQYGLIDPSNASLGSSYIVNVSNSVPCGAEIDFKIDYINDQGILGTVHKFLKVGVVQTPADYFPKTGTVPPAPITIPDASSFGLSTYIDVDSTATIGSVFVRINSITHPHVGDLKLTLTSPDGDFQQSAVLLQNLSFGSGLGAGTNITDITFDDSASAGIQTQTGPLVDGTYRPFQPLGVFKGMSATGRWKLTVADLFAPYRGQLVSWSIGFSTTADSCTGARLMDNAVAKGPTGWESQVWGNPSDASATYQTGQPPMFVLHTEPSSQPRIPVWTTPGVVCVNYPNQVYRLNAFVSRSGQPDLSNQAQIPNMRMMLRVRYAMDNTAMWQFDPTISDPETNQIMLANAPSTDTLHPTHYHVDFQPIPVPAMFDPTPQEMKGAIMNYSMYPNEQGNLNVIEADIERYPAPEDNEGTVIRTYASKDLASGYGYVSRYNFSNPDPTLGTPNSCPIATTGTQGITLDSTFVPQTGLSAVGYDFVPIDGNEPIMKAGKTYRVRYHLASNTDSNNMPQIRLRARSAKFSYTNMMDIANSKGAGTLTNLIASQAQPGVGSLNPFRRATETQGGYYDQFVDPMNVLPDTDNLKRLRFGIDLVDGVSPTSDAYQSSVAGRVLLDSIEVREFNQH